MKKVSLSRFVSWGAWLFIIIPILWLAYDNYFKSVLEDYKQERLEENLVENFHEKREEFYALREMAKGLGDLKSVAFKEDGTVSLEILDSLSRNNDSTGYNIMDLYFTDLTEGKERQPYDMITHFEFSDSNSITVNSRDVDGAVCEKWKISYEGKLDNPYLKELLAYEGNTVNDLKELRGYLKKLDCIEFEKSDNMIVIRYRGSIFSHHSYYSSLDKEGKAFKHSSANDLDEYFYWVLDDGLLKSLCY